MIIMKTCLLVLPFSQAQTQMQPYVTLLPIPNSYESPLPEISVVLLGQKLDPVRVVIMMVSSDSKTKGPVTYRDHNSAVDLSWVSVSFSMCMWPGFMDSL